MNKTDNRQGENQHLDSQHSNSQHQPTNEQQSDQAWQQLQADWQSYEPDVKKIKQKISWVTWRMIALLTLDVIALFAYIGFLYLEIFQSNEHWLITSWFYLMGVAVLYGVYIDFKLRLPVFRLQGESSRDVLNLYLERTQVGIKLGLVCQYIFCGVLVLFWLWRYLVVQYFAEESIYNRNDITLTISLWLFVCIAGSYWYKNKKHKEYQQLKLLWQDFVD